MSQLGVLLDIVRQWRKAHDSAERAFDQWFSMRPRSRARRMARARFRFFRREQRELEVTLLRLARREVRYLKQIGVSRAAKFATSNRSRP